jgi:hypothetical protein
MKQVDQVTPLLLEKLWLAMVAVHKGKGVNIRNISVLKSALVESLLRQDNPLMAVLYLPDEIVRQIDLFLTQQQAKAGYQKPQMLSAATLMAGSGAIAAHFTTEERIGVARSLIRKFDTANRYHCNVSHCGDRCEFALQCCGNVGCGVKFSRKWGPAHDSVCAHKIISCQLLCGEHVVRQNAGAHMANDCIMREVPCPYNHIGCAPPSKYIATPAGVSSQCSFVCHLRKFSFIPH